MNAILLHLLTTTCYAALSLYFWRVRRHSFDHTRKSAPSGKARVFLFVTLCLHGAAVGQTLFPGQGMHFGFGIAVSLTVWLAVLFYWTESLRTGLAGLQMIVMPFAAVFSLVPLFFPGTHALNNEHTLLFKVHFLVGMLAYSLFTLAALHALVMSFAEKRLHHAALDTTLLNMPPLLTMEHLLFKLIRVAFSLLTLTVISGVFFSEAMFHRPFQLDHKTLFALLSWMIFGALLLGRRFRGWRGAVATQWMLAGFIMLLLAYLGSRFVLEIILGRTA